MFEDTFSLDVTNMSLTHLQNDNTSLKNITEYASYAGLERDGQHSIKVHRCLSDLNLQRTDISEGTYDFKMHFLIGFCTTVIAACIYLSHPVVTQLRPEHISVENDSRGNEESVRLVGPAYKQIEPAGLENLSDIHSIQTVALLEDYNNRKRRKRTSRTLMALGVAAAVSLLKGAKSLPGSKDFRRFQKTGDITNALRDFYAAHPDRVHTEWRPREGREWTGKVGDRELRLKYRGEDGKPTLDVRFDSMNADRESLPTDRIIYRTED